MNLKPPGIDGRASASLPMGFAQATHSNYDGLGLNPLVSLLRFSGFYIDSDAIRYLAQFNIPRIPLGICPILALS